MRTFTLISALAAGVLAAQVALAGACDPGAPAGRYVGHARMPDGEIREIILNLRCDAGGYVARFFSSTGDFPAKDAVFANGDVVVTFDYQGFPSVATLAPAGADLGGEFAVASFKQQIAMTRMADAWAENAWRPRLDLTTAQWREDLALLARELPRRHANAFAFLTRPQFEARVADIDRRLPTLGPDQVFASLGQLVNAIGDGHTGIVSPADAVSQMPLELALVGGEFRVVAAGLGLERALGAKVIRIGAVPIARAHALALTLTPTHELAELREGRVVFYLARGLTLHGLGITPQRQSARYTFQDDAGHVFSLTAHDADADHPATMTSLRPKTALAAQNPDDPFWCRPLPQNHALYCAWRGYDGLHGKTQAMWTLIDQLKPDKLILDMRDNGGGDNTVGEAQLVAPLEARADLNQRGHLYVLIGPLTFSAAMNNAAQFQDQTNAILVGQTIGERPNSYQEPRQFRLPNSHLIVRASTLYYAFRKTGENAVRPTHEIIPTWADIKSGRDPALEWVLTQ